MKGPHNIWRLIRTGATLERTGGMTVILNAFNCPTSLRVLARVLGWPFKWLGLKGDLSMPPATRALSALGPAYIKFGQILSTRPDIVGDDLAKQLRILQDKLPPFPTSQAKRTIEMELGAKIETLFSEFSEPVAAASIAQVHKAKISETGEVVAIKVLRPKIEKAFRKDIDAFYFAAKVIEIISASARRLKPSDVIKHFDDVVQGELDLKLEAAAAGEYASITQNDDGFTVPKAHFFYTSKRVMTMDWVDGIPFGETLSIEAAGFDKKALSERLLKVFLRQALNDGYFHADMHQGNIKVDPSGKIVAYDFGIMGRIDEYTRRVYAEILIGFIKKDYKRVAEVHFEAGYVPSHQDIDEFSQALRAVGEPIFGMDSTQISMGKLLTYLFEVTERFGMETRTELILLQRTMVVVEGVSRTMYPQINIWEVAQPIVQEYINKSVGPKALLNDLIKTGTVISRFGPRLPKLMETLLNNQTEHSKSKVVSNKKNNNLRFFVFGSLFGIITMIIYRVF
ncbi:MAG: 2-polyprenylphenol 6-hydroxylase [Paracoccaceae bacterium]